MTLAAVHQVQAGGDAALVARLVSQLRHGDYTYSDQVSGIIVLEACAPGEPDERHGYLQMGALGCEVVVDLRGADGLPRVAARPPVPRLPSLSNRDRDVLAWVLRGLLEREPEATMLALEAQLGRGGTDDLLGRLDLLGQAA